MESRTSLASCSCSYHGRADISMGMVKGGIARGTGSRAYLQVSEKRFDSLIAHFHHEADRKGSNSRAEPADVFRRAPHDPTTLGSLGQFDTEILRVELVIMLSSDELVSCIPSKRTDSCAQVELNCIGKAGNTSAQVVHMVLYQVQPSCYPGFGEESSYSLSSHPMLTMICHKH